jgi:predicted phage baseplate assembly protein
MTLKAPNLDDRKFQDIVTEVRGKIPKYCPDWTDYNLSDPGVTLIELFAWMVDLLLYRLNQVPEKNYIKFMDLIGIHLSPPIPATADVTFRFSAPQPEAITIPQGTEVATVRTETQDAITFTTNKDLTIIVPTLSYALVTSGDSSFKDFMPSLKKPDLPVPIFEDVPQENNAIYLGYSKNLNSHSLALTISCIAEGIGIDPHDPPLVWEFWDGYYEKWSTVRLDSDTTGGLNTSGLVQLHIPQNCMAREIDGKNACWLRCRVIKHRPKQRSYSGSPKIKSITSESIGGTVIASHATQFSNEFLGQSDGTPGQRFWLRNVPVLSRRLGEIIEVEGPIEGEYEPWEEVSDFANSGPVDSCFTCDSVSGEIQFGPSIRQPTGEERQYGRVPPAGHRIRFTTYRCGGGVSGNVGEGTIAVLKSSIPYLASVTNHAAAKGGTDAETIESAKLRAPKALRARTRAVTTDDYEYFALEASPLIARAKCLPPGGTEGLASSPGVVQLLLVPKLSETDRPIVIEELEIPRKIREEVQLYLDERRLLATTIEIGNPEYIPVDIVARIKTKRRSNPEKVAHDVERRLYHFINPVCGGPDGDGWAFGRSIFQSEVYAVIQAIAGVDYIEEVSLFPIKDGEREETTTSIKIPANSLACSHKHEIVIDT